MQQSNCTFDEICFIMVQHNFFFLSSVDSFIFRKTSTCCILNNTVISLQITYCQHWFHIFDTNIVWVPTYFTNFHAKLYILRFWTCVMQKKLPWWSSLAIRTSPIWYHWRKVLFVSNGVSISSCTECLDTPSVWSLSHNHIQHEDGAWSNHLSHKLASKLASITNHNIRLAVHAKKKKNENQEMSCDWAN